jgi:hypothetical protein
MAEYGDTCLCTNDLRDTGCFKATGWHRKELREREPYQDYTATTCISRSRNSRMGTRKWCTHTTSNFGKPVDKRGVS